MNEERNPIIHVEVPDALKRRIDNYLASSKSQYYTISELVRAAVSRELDRVGA